MEHADAGVEQFVLGILLRKNERKQIINSPIAYKNPSASNQGRRVFILMKFSGPPSRMVHTAWRGCLPPETGFG